MRKRQTGRELLQDNLRATFCSGCDKKCICDNPRSKVSVPCCTNDVSGAIRTIHAEKLSIPLFLEQAEECRMLGFRNAKYEGTGIHNWVFHPQF